MVAFPSTLPCPTLKSGSSAETQSFIRTQFDFGVRQRRVPRGYVTQSFSVIVPHSDLDTWETFWVTSLNYGTDPFEYDYMVHGSDNITKVVRFTAPYSLTALGNNIYNITCSLEVLSAGTAKADTMDPLYPYNTLYPSATLQPT